jgi:hypothetical protein
MYVRIQYLHTKTGTGKEQIDWKDSFARLRMPCSAAVILLLVSAAAETGEFRERTSVGHKFGDHRSKRRVGSQREVPHLSISAGNSSVSVRSYQSYNLDASGAVVAVSHTARDGKFAYVRTLLRRLRAEGGCSTLADVGCSAGLVGLIALSEGYGGGL